MDILLDFDSDALAGDVRLLGADLAADASLRTAVVVSLFTDRRATRDDELPAGESDRRGWWGDALAGEDGDRIGSRLWLLAREKHLDTVLVRAEEYAAEALAWLTADGIAQSVEVAAEWVGRGLLALRIVLVRPSGDILQFRFNHLWEGV